MKCTFSQAFVACALGIFTILSGAQTASARIGETKDQIIERYGEVVKDVDPTVSASEGATVHIKDQIEVTVEFKRGKAWLVSFRASSVHMKSAFEDELRDANDGVDTVGDWEDAYKHLGRTYWVTSDKSIYAVLYETGVHKIYRFFTAECILELKTERKQLVQDAKPGQSAAAIGDEDKDEEGEKKEGKGF